MDQWVQEALWDLEVRWEVQVDLWEDREVQWDQEDLWAWVLEA